MTAIALLVGNSTYKSLNSLPCCLTDVDAMGALLRSTEKFDNIHIFLNDNSVDLKQKLRTVLDNVHDAQEILFYFSGHGYSDQRESYYCSCDFDLNRPNETGLPDSELMAILRESSPNLVVKIIDACASGNLLIKAGHDFVSSDKSGLRNLIQIASCLDSQTSLSGDPLSEFTARFCRAAISRSEGQLYYTDVVAILRDLYIEDQERMPHFIIQASARETFVDDARKLVDFARRFTLEWSIDQPGKVNIGSDIVSVVESTPAISTALSNFESQLAKSDDVTRLVSTLFDGLKTRLGTGEFKNCFDFSSWEHDNYFDDITRAFIIRVLNQEKRQDEFVATKIKRKANGKRSFLGIPDPRSFLGLYNDDFVADEWDLILNVEMNRAQLHIMLTPKYSALQQINLVISCAPSLEYCYIFEMATRHSRINWESFSPEGTELTRRWYKVAWHSNIEWLVNKISTDLELSVTDHVEAVAKRLSKR